MVFMPYVVVYLNEFAIWLSDQDEDRRLRIIAHLDLLQQRGPLLSRPYAETLKGSRIAKLKELRVQHKSEPIRILFAFDSKQQAVVILGGSKQASKRWYDTYIPIAEKIYQDYLEEQRKADEESAREEREK